MSLFSSLYTGVNGMNAQSQATAGISENIANLNTVGYKKYDTAFQDLVVNSRPSRFTHGGVYTQQIQRIDRQGGLQQTQSLTDAGIAGKGFFIVKAQPTADSDFLFTRNGSFSPDPDGVLRNSAGFALYGWPVDQNGATVGGSDFNTLVALDIDELNSQFLQTTSGDLAINLNASEEADNPHLLSPAQSLPVGDASAPDFVRNMTVYDATGTPRDLQFQFRKIVGPMAYASSQATTATLSEPLTGSTLFPNIASGDTFTVTVGAASQQYIVGAAAGAGQVRIDTLGDLVHDINANLGGGTVLDAALDGEGRLILRAADPTATLSLTEDSGTPLSGAGTLDFVTQPGNAALTYTPNAPLTGGAAYPDQADFPAFADSASPNTYGWWEMTVLTNDPADPDGLTLPPVAISRGLLNFNGTGVLNALPGANGAVSLNLANIDFDGAASGEEIAALSIDMGRFSQFSGSYNVLLTDQNGAEAGTLAGVEIGRDGTVNAQFSNGQEVAVYRIPLAVFVNPNGLNARTGTVFEMTHLSGDADIVAAGTGGAGFLNPATLENSNVDLADEFASLIVSQRAFSANSRVVNTVDEMTQQLRQLKT